MKTGKQIHDEILLEHLKTRNAQCGWCGRKGKRIDFVSVWRNIPTSARGWYCEGCDEKVIKKYYRICAICGERYTERMIDGNSKICQACASREVSHELKRLQQNLDRAIEAGTPATLTIDEWIKTLEHFNYKCSYCGKDYEVLEHYIPVSKGGGTTKDNCVPACASCNNLKRSKHPDNLKQKDFKRIGVYLQTF